MEAKVIQKYKGKSIASLLKSATTHFNKYIRYRDTDEYGYGNCISSGQSLRVPSSNAHAGHFFSGGKFPRLRFDEDNVHLQGKSDNYFNSGNELMYRIRLVEKIGEERVKRLEQIAMNKTPHKWDRFTLIEIIETYKEKSKELEKDKMF